jgi:hypothetical protein
VPKNAVVGLQEPSSISSKMRLSSEYLALGSCSCRLRFIPMRMKGICSRASWGMPRTGSNRGGCPGLGYLYRFRLVPSGARIRCSNLRWPRVGPRSYRPNLNSNPPGPFTEGLERAKNAATSGCAGSPQRTALRWLNSLITGKIQGISPKLGPARMPGSLKTNRFATKFPRGKTGNFF